MSKEQRAPGELELVRSFVNTLDIERDSDALATPGALAQWLSEHGLASAPVEPSPAALRRAHELREALRAILLSHNGGSDEPHEAWRTLDRAAVRAGLRVRFGPAGTPHLEADDDGVDGALGGLLAIVHGASARPETWTRLKACRLHGCEWAFYDHTKNRSGTWCNMAVCGNRAKARAYRERHARRA